MDRLVEDVAFLSRELPGTMMAFHDPNFGVKLDEVLSALETAPPGRRVPYVMESSLSILRGERAARLGQTNCLVAAPGVESWNEFSKKAAAGHMSGRAKSNASSSSSRTSTATCRICRRTSCSGWTPTRGPSRSS
jgi:hypothetical protein